MNELYPIRSFKIPSGWATIDVATDDYTDDVINILYNQESCCLGQRGSNQVNALMKGEKCGCCDDNEFLIMALYVLRNWYNSNPASFTFTIAYLLTGYTINFNIYYVPSQNSQVITNPILNASFIYSSYSQLLTELQAALPAGYTATLNGDEITITLPDIVYPYDYIWINQAAIGGGLDEQNNQWDTIFVFNPCLPYPAVQLIIQKCLQICGCINCQTAATLEKDNNYVPVGVRPPALISSPCSYENIFWGC